MSAPYRIAILDDEPVWIEAIVALLTRSSEIQVVGTACTQAEAVALAAGEKPDLFLVDVNLGHAFQNGISATSAILEASPETEVVVLTAAEQDQHVVDAISVGAIDYLQKSNCELLLPAILRHMRHEFSPNAVLARSYAELRRENIRQTLTENEYELLEQLSENVSRSELTRKLRKSENTVKTQIRSILHKLGVTSATEAVKKLKNGGVLVPEDVEETTSNASRRRKKGS